jgi:D-sedoheptulose 7-phosphate isomerase
MENFNYSELINALNELNNSAVPTNLSKLANEMVKTINSGNKIILFGNGGSAAEASHFAAELVSKCSKDHKPWPAICLNDSDPIITAIGNDYGFENIFKRQIEGFAKTGDLIVGFSTSGHSKNVICAVEQSVLLGLKTFLFTGPNHKSDLQCELIVAPVEDTPRIQEIHLIWLHFLSEYCENNVD